MLLIYLIFFIAFDPISRYLTPKHNNVCKTFRDYYFPDGNENCYYDPDTTLETPELIKKYAGVVETHEVTSEDGYILTMFRIPKENPRGVILLHHSIATYSHIYLWQGNNSLALTLWRNGFDVWLANQRGTTYSDRHVNLTNFDFPYWNFGFHEMGVYDVSSELELIREKTNGSKVIFFGHSLGSAIGLVYSSLKAIQAEEYLKSMVLLAAPAYFDHSTSLIFLFKNFGPVIERFFNSICISSPLLFETSFNSICIGSPLLLLPVLLPISRVVLRIFPVLLFIVNVLVWGFCGYTPNETDPVFYNYDGMIYENNFSWKTLIHFIQLTNCNHRFQMYDYGKVENFRIYGQEVPPLYPVQEIRVPTLLVSSYNDSLISLEDSESLFQELSPEARKHGHWKLTGLNHLDYHIGLHRKEIFVDNLLAFLISL